MNERLSIGRVASLYGVSHDTLRLYDKKGLVVPVVDPDTGYRSYTLEHLGLLDTVMLGRATRTPLKRLKEVIDAESLEAYASLHEQQKDSIERQMTELVRAKSKVEYLSKLARRAQIVRAQGRVLGVLGRDVRLCCRAVEDVLSSAQADAPAVDTPEYLRFRLAAEQGAREDEEYTYFEEPDADNCVLLGAACPTVEVWGTLARIRKEAALLLQTRNSSVFARFDYVVSHHDGNHEYLCTLASCSVSSLPQSVGY